MTMKMVFRGYAKDSKGYHGGGVFLKDEKACADFLFTAANTDGIDSVMITDMFDCPVAETLSGSFFLDYLHPDYRIEMLNALIPLQTFQKEPEALDFTFLKEEDQEIMKEYGEVYAQRFNFDAVRNGVFSI